MIIGKGQNRPFVKYLHVLTARLPPSSPCPRTLSKRKYTTTAMATASKIKLSPSHRPVFAVSKLTQDSADLASRLLQTNHDKHHIFFNTDGFHNHIVHQVLTLYALGAPPSVLQQQYDQNASYQLPQREVNSKTLEELYDEETFGQHLGTNEDYVNYLAFFTKEIDKNGWQSVVNKYLFSGGEKADDMLVRCFGGFLHPLIHLGFGIEFDQPAIIAEALAQTAVHDSWMGGFLLGAEKLAKSRAGQPSKSLMELTNEGRANTKLVKSVRDTDGNKLREGVIGRAGEQMINLAAQYTVKPDELKAKCAEMIEYCAHYTLASQRPEKELKVDFFLMHDFNCSIFFPGLLTDPRSSWLSPENKARLLEWKARGDLAQYFARASPELLLDEVKNFKPKKTFKGPANGHAMNGHATNGDTASSADGWSGVYARAFQLEDDGHLVKLLRAVANGEQYCEGNIASPTITGDMWLKMGQMALQSVDDRDINPNGERWVRSTGFESAWADVPARTKASL